MNQAILKTDILYDQLRRELSKYAPGDKFITSREIMKRFNVSQLIVDRTVVRFRSAGLLRVVPGRGTFVTEEIGKLHEEVPPTFLFAVPRWNSSDLTLMEQYLEKARKKYVRNRILVHSYDYSERVPAALPLEEENVAGIAMLTSADSWDSGVLYRLEEYASRVPLVVMNRHRGDMQLLSVGVNDTFAGNLAVNHLFNNGHRKIAVLISEPHNGVIRERLNGVLNYAELHGMQCRVLDCGIRSGDYAPEKSYRYFAEVLKNGIDFTALVGVGADSFAGAVNACHNAGIRIPDELSLVTVDSKQNAEIQHPPLDCVDVNLAGQIEAILEILSHPGNYAPDSNPYEYFKPELEINGSVKRLNVS
ncbi:MAG: substrate-binding domain-containing protein [Lentisphaeria bacterium]|nr:substrate-binding domain-containing protein [Lentisphaeria bacterium]